MALSAKVFRLDEELPQEIIFDKLRNYRVVDEVEGVRLERFFKDVVRVGSYIRGTYVFDEPIEMDVAGDVRLLPRRRYAEVAFTDYGGSSYLIILEKKFRANRIALELSEILFISRGKILEAYTSHEILKSLHESSPESTRVIYFDNVDIPNIKKLALYGEALADTELYSEYLRHGLIWYVVFEHRETGYVVGLTRNMIVVLFSKSTSDEFIDFIIRHIIPLVR